MSLRLKSVAGAVALALACGACTLEETYADVELYSGFTLVDPATETLTRQAWLTVRGGLIDEIGAGAPPQGDFSAVHDVSGLYGMPGLIDAHAHITVGPFRASFEGGTPGVEMISGDRYSRFHAAVALAFGVTTVRNPGGSTTANARYDEMVASGEWAGPQALHAGSVIQPPPMSGESFAYPTSPQAWDAEAAAQAAAGMTYFKLYHGLTEDELAQGVAAAKAHGLTPIAHLDSVSWTRAAELGIEQLEHALPTSADLLEPEARGSYSSGDPTGKHMFRWFELMDLDAPLMTHMIGTLRERRIVVNLTLVANEIVYHADDTQRVFPEPERIYYEPESFASAMANYGAIASIWTEEDFARAAAAFTHVLAFAKALYDAGVALMIGTDGTGGGPMYARELAHHVAAGIPSWQVLRMATAGNAALMGLENTGRIAPAREADLVFLRADPTEDVRNVREVELVVTNGTAYRPDELLGIAREIAAAAEAHAAD